MTVKQKQCLLCCLGYYQGAIDGIWGARSASAARAFQQDQGLAADEGFGKASQEKLLECITQLPEDVREGVRYFQKREFACKCGSCGGWPAEVSPVLLRLADQVRGHFGAPATVSSGLRCQKHNAAVGGVRNSRHLLGKAMDFSVRGVPAEQVLAYVRTQPQVRYAYAINDAYVHMDVA